jgi:H+/Cl- antiporter ClcA
LTLTDRLTDVITGIGIALISVPVAFIVTILLVPFWSWLEAMSGFESLGHSGPAEWCYIIMYIFLIFIGSWLLSLLKKRSGIH